MKVAAAEGAGYVVSHTGGLPPRTDPVGIDYGPGCRRGRRAARPAAGAERAVASGVDASAVLVDPTLDFGKTTLNSLRLVAETGRVVALGYPVLQAISRKDFVGETLDLPADERLEAPGRHGHCCVARCDGLPGTRCAATRRVLDMVASIRGDRPPAVPTVVARTTNLPSKSRSAPEILGASLVLGRRLGVAAPRTEASLTQQLRPITVSLAPGGNTLRGMQKLLILGGGTAGTMVANRLRRELSEQWQITVVDRDDVHVYQPALLFIPFGKYPVKRITKSRRAQFASGVEFIQAEIRRVSSPRRIA